MRSIVLLLPLLAACAASVPPMDETLSEAQRQERARVQLAAADSAYQEGDVPRAIALSGAALQVYPAGHQAYLAKWTYLNHQVEQKGLGDSAAVGEVEADLETLAQREWSAELVRVRTQGYEYLYAWTEEGAYRASNRALLEAFLSEQAADTAGFDFLNKLRSLVETPQQAEEAYRRILASAPAHPLGHLLYAELARLAVDHPDLVPSPEAEADFLAWSDYLAQGAVGGGRQSQFYLWRAEYQLRRLSDGVGAGQWLSRAEAARSEDAAVHARLHWLVGEEARLAGAESRAQANFEAAWELAAPLLDSTERGLDFARTVKALRQRLDRTE